MCHSANVATMQAMTEGLVSTGAVMVPCPWFPEIAEWAREHPEADLGVHLTHTAEWRTYRWGSVASRGDVPGLLDDEGFLWRKVPQVVEHASPEEIEIEMRAQIERARQFGLKPTHVDTHMGTMFASKAYLDVYLRVSREMGVMPMLFEPRPWINERLARLGVDYPVLAERLHAEGYVLLDHMARAGGGDTLEERQANYHQALRDLKPGVSLMILHLNGDDAEVRAITNDWPNRYHELRIFTSSDTRALIEAESIKLIGYREVARLCEFSAPA